MSSSILEPLTIQSKFGSYQVMFQDLDNISFSEEQIFLVDNFKSVLNKVKKIDTKKIIEILATEDKKNVAEGTKILEMLAEMKATKNSSIVAFGGGIVQDLTTFVSSLYMRGLSWKYFPTTLMSAMDSCIGGKSSINLGKFKNIVGNFYPPKEVVIDLHFSKTLNRVDVSSGISEGMKICFAKDHSTFEEFRSRIIEWRKKDQISALQEATWFSLSAKKWFIEVDEFDRKERKLLNFGHSFGHALEAASSFVVPHGIGVLIGMKAAIYESGNQTSCNNLIGFINEELDESDFRTTTVKVSKSVFLDALSRDKKNSKVNQVLILPNREGKLEIVTRPLTDIALESCLDSLQKSLEESFVNCEIF